MARRKKGSVRSGHGAMCNICGRNCGKGGPLKKHVEAAHQVSYDDYNKCFYGNVKTVLAEAWDDQVSTNDGRTVIVHVLVRRFVGDTGHRGATKSVPSRV